MITFKKIKYDDIPEAIRKRVLRWSDKEVTIDDMGLTRTQLQRLIDYMQQEGYQEV